MGMGSDGTHARGLRACHDALAIAHASSLAAATHTPDPQATVARLQALHAELRSALLGPRPRLLQLGSPGGRAVWCPPTGDPLKLLELWDYEGLLGDEVGCP